MTGAAPDAVQGGSVPERVVLYAKPGCHLCDDARSVIKTVCAELGVGYREIDINTSAELMDAYGEQIPVTLVDGRHHDFWRVDATRLRRALDPSV